MIGKKIIPLFLLSIILVSNSSFYKLSQSDTQEYVLKAAFIYRFTDYIEWESNNDDQNFTIRVLGESSTTTPLKEIARDKKIKGKNISIKGYNDVNDIGSCQILFISRNYKADIETVLSIIGNQPILVITEQSGACEKGAHINFLILDNKLKFEINFNAATKAGLHISSQLLQHAIIVNSP